MRILVTGAAGYIGSVLVDELLQKQYLVKGFDILYFGDKSLSGFYNHNGFEFIKGDIRKKSDLSNAVNDIDAVIHLAAIVGDPACAKEPSVAEETNLIAGKMLFDLCNRSKNVKRFVFASTCSNYGKMSGDGFVNEDSPLNPVSLYAKLKVEFEKYILKTKTREDFVPTTLRFATAFGVSPRIRFDLTVNEFVKEVFMGRGLVVFGERFWRPYCHVRDLARACIYAVEDERGSVNKDVFNVGDTSQNYQKQTLVELIKKSIPELKVRFVLKDEDPRDYRVNFDKIKNKLGFRITKTVEDGIVEILALLRSGNINDPDGNLYKNI